MSEVLIEMRKLCWLGLGMIVVFGDFVFIEVVLLSNSLGVFVVLGIFFYRIRYFYGL